MSTAPPTPISLPTANTVMLDHHHSNQNIIDTGDHGGEGFTAASPPLWKTGPQAQTKAASHSNHHRYRVVSSSTRSQQIAKDREKLMELIQNMPEDSYELSLKDIVEKPVVVQGVQQTTVVEEEEEETSVHADANQRKLGKKKANGQKNDLLRSGSMSGENVGLKMFFPTSLGIRKSSKLKPCSKVSPRHRSIVEQKNVDRRRWWKKRFLVHDETKHNNSSKTMVKSTSCNGRTGRTLLDLLPSCWSFCAKER